jgi:uncharacterized protein (TIGR02996 family)
MKTVDSFIEGIFADPEDISLRLVFADWLEERGDPRAEYVRLDCQLAALPADEARQEQLLRRKKRLQRSYPELLCAWDRTMAVARIRSKLEVLRGLDTGMDLFGSETHRYRLNPCLTEEKLTAFEKHVGVTLPEDYRLFLRLVGNGEAGPHYGLYPLDLDWDIQEWPLHEPFPISTKRARTIIARQLKGYYRPTIDYPLPGCLEMSEFGCGIVAFLVVTGEQRGTIWYGGDGLTPAMGRDAQQVGFLGWYENWLDESLEPGAIERERKLHKQR